MSVQRHYTVGAVAPGLRTLAALGERLEALGLPDSLIVLVRRRDEALVRVTLPEARVRRVEAGLTRLQWFELGSVYLAVTSVSVLLGAIHLLTGLILQAILTLAVVVGLAIYRRRPQLQKKLLGMALPEKLAGAWEESFSSGGFALALSTVPEERFEEAQEAFLDEDLDAPLAVDRRPVL